MGRGQAGFSARFADEAFIAATRAILEQALGQSDLIPLYRQLRDQAARG